MCQLLFSSSTSCDSFVIMARGRHKIHRTGQTTRYSLIWCSLKKTCALAVRPVFSASTGWKAEMVVCSSTRADILSVIAAGLNVWRKRKKTTVGFVQMVTPRQIWLSIPAPTTPPLQQKQRRKLIHQSCWLYLKTSSTYLEKNGKFAPALSCLVG